MSLKTLNGDQAMAFGALSSGMKHVYTSGPDDLDSTPKGTFPKALSHKDLTLIIIRLEK